MQKTSRGMRFSLLIINQYYTPKKFHEGCSLVYLANYIKLSLCITNYHINIVVKHRLIKGSMACGMVSRKSHKGCTVRWRLPSVA